MTISEELTQLGKEIDSAHKSVAGLEGRKAEVTERLEKEFGIKTVSAANKELDKLTKEITTKEETIESDFVSLKGQFSW